MKRPAFATVVLDVDSTISGVEGIDWLAAQRDASVAAEVVRLTDEAMRGVIPLESVYSGRLAAIRPTRSDIHALSRAYLADLAPGCVQAVADLQAEGVRVVMISGGLRQAIVPVAAALGVSDADLHAVDIRFDAQGEYAEFDTTSPLATSLGKPALINTLLLPRPLIAVGDGSTDLAMRGVADIFAAFTGFVAREPVVSKADIVVQSFTQLASIVLNPSGQS